MTRIVADNAYPAPHNKVPSPGAGRGDWGLGPPRWLDHHLLAGDPIVVGVDLLHQRRVRRRRTKVFIGDLSVIPGGVLRTEPTVSRHGVGGNRGGFGRRGS